MCGKSQPELYFANGMFNDYSDSYQSALHLMSEYNKSHTKVDRIKVAFNSNEFFTTQLYQVLRQKVDELEVSIWTYLSSKLNPDSALNRKILKIYADSLNRKDIDLKKQIESYRSVLNKSKDVVTVAHSQGNLYTNLAFGSIASTQTKMISVATPASRVYNSSPPNYFTFTNDHVIRFIPSALTPNVASVANVGLNHSFIFRYMNESGSKKLILKQMSEALSTSHPFFGNRFNSDLNPTINWFLDLLNSKKRLKDEECLVGAVLFGLEEAHALECSERNLATVRLHINDCVTDFEKKFERDTNCPYYEGLHMWPDRPTQMPTPDILQFYNDHPECEFGIESFKKKGVSLPKTAVKLLDQIQDASKASEDKSEN